MEPIVYDNDILRKHSLYPHCCNTLQNVSNRDYPNRYSFNPQIECLDIDPYEKKIHSGHPNNTKDINIQMVLNMRVYCVHYSLYGNNLKN